MPSKIALRTVLAETPKTSAASLTDRYSRVVTYEQAYRWRVTALAALMMTPCPAWMPGVAARMLAETRL
jgi:hypothetical protein